MLSETHCSYSSLGWKIDRGFIQSHTRFRWHGIFYVYFWFSTIFVLFCVMLTFFTAFCIFIEVLKRTQNMQCDTIQAVDFNARHMQIRSEIDSFIEQGERERVKEAYQILWFLYGLWLHHFYQSTKSNALNKIFGIFNT